MLCTYLFAQPSWGIYMSKNPKVPVEKTQGKLNVCFQKNPYLPHRRYFSLDPPPPHLSGNSSQASYIYLNFWAFENPQPQGISNPFRWESMGILYEKPLDIAFY